MTRLIFVDTGKEINQDVMSLMAFLVETYSDRQILLALEEALYNSLTKEFKKSSYLIVPFTEKLISSGDEVVVFQNSNYDKIKRDIARGAINDKIVKLFMPDAFFLTESNIFRNETSSYFTFSPFQDTQRFFSSLSDGSSIKRQLCIRYINKGDLTNPLFMSVHICYSYQRYSYENQWKNICFVIDILSNEYLIEKNRILIRYHKSCKAYIQPQMEEYKTEMCDDDNFVAHLNIPGTHFYVKVFYEHDNGLLPFVNFVLVDIRNNLSKLDSIIYQDRLELIKESKTYIMELDRYKRLVEEVTRNQPQLLNQELHELTNHFIAIFSLLYMRIKGSNKGVGNELKRKVKALAIFVKYYAPRYSPLKNIESVAKEIKTMYGFDSDCTEVISEFMHMYTSVNKVMEKNISKLERLKDMYSYEELITSFGIPKEEFGYRHTYFSDNYPFI